MAREITLRIALPALCVWFGLVMGAIYGETSWAVAVAVPTFVTGLLAISAARKVARGERRYTQV